MISGTYLEIHGELAPGWPAVVRWQSGQWSGEEAGRETIRQAILLEGRPSPAGPTVAQSAPDSWPSCRS